MEISVSCQMNEKSDKLKQKRESRAEQNDKNERDKQKGLERECE